MALSNSKFSDQYRYGIKVILHEFLKQYDTYLRAVYLHGNGHINEALELYTDTLEKAGPILTNSIHRFTLENLNLIVIEKRELTSKFEDLRRRKHHFITSMSEATQKTWKDISVPRQLLSQHYIQERSVILVADSEYQRIVYKALANKYLLKIFFGLEDHDKFGFIPLNKEASIGVIPLENRGTN